MTDLFPGGKEGVMVSSDGKSKGREGQEMAGAVATKKEIPEAFFLLPVWIGFCAVC